MLGYDLSLIVCVINTLSNLCISCVNLNNMRIDNWIVHQEFYGEEFMSGDVKIFCPQLVFL